MLLSSTALLASLFAVGSAQADDSSWTDHIAVSGDARFRNEWSITRPGESDMRWRQRVRFRLGVTGTVIDDQFWAGARLRTGNAGDPNSPHQTLGGDFTSFGVNFDRVFLKWAPGGGPSTIWAGKFEHPFYDSPVYSDTIIDNDINPEGVAANLAVVSGEGVNWSLKPAAYLLLENNAGAGDMGFDTNDGYLFAAQSQLDIPAGDASVTIANAFYAIPDPTPADNSDLLLMNNGNAVNAAGTEYVEDFMILDNVVGAIVPVGDTKLKLGGRFTINLGASSENIGWQAGAKLPFDAGKLGMEVFADAHGMQREAFYSDWIGDDHQVGSGYVGAVGGLTFKPVKALGIRVWGIFDRSDAATSADPAINSRVRVDVNAKF